MRRDSLDELTCAAGRHPPNVTPADTIFKLAFIAKEEVFTARALDPASSDEGDAACAPPRNHRAFETRETKGAVMALLRGRRDDGGTKYRMREKLFSIGDDFWIEDAEGERAFKVDGKALRIRDTLVLEDRSGAELFTVQEKKLHVRDTMEIEHGGNTVAKVKKALITPLRDRFSIEVEDGDDLEAKGNVVDHEYKIERDGHRVAEVSKRWFRVRDTYGIEVAPGQDDAFILAVTVCIDQMSRN
jgi:uncharacterized protein YxjI